jgi:hypothetical protein
MRAGDVTMCPLARRSILLALLIFGLDVASAAEPAGEESRIRLSNGRIEEIFRYAMRKSPSFGELVATIELLDRVVYVEEGSCRPHSRAGCLHMMPAAAEAKNLLIRFDSRQPIRLAAAALAHELYHALEIAREKTVTDPASLRQLFARIGERSCPQESDDCWETRAATAFEALVLSELVGGHQHR